MSLSKQSPPPQTERIILLPNHKNIILAAESARDVSPKSVVVIPTKSAPQGLNSLLALDLSGDLETTAVAMQTRAFEIITAEISRATRSVEIDGVAVQAGDYIGLIDGQLLAAHAAVTAVFDNPTQNP